MKKTMTFALAAIALPLLNACNSPESDTTTATPPANQTEAGSGIEADTAVTLDPDTSLYHDMTL